MKKPLTAERLRKIVSYNPETGSMVWIAPRALRPGQEVGSKRHDGYRVTVILTKRYVVHRLAWLYVYGEWPALSIDHINGVRDDNRIANLRLATPKDQAANQKLRRSNKSGHKGVCWDKISRKWRASCRAEFLGFFDTAEEAASAYRKRASKVYGPFMRLE